MKNIGDANSNFKLSEENFHKNMKAAKIIDILLKYEQKSNDFNLLVALFFAFHSEFLFSRFEF